MEVITKSLERIKLLFSDTDRPEKRYGLKPSAPDGRNRNGDVDPSSRNSMNIFRASYKRFWVRNAASSGKYSLISKTK
jgi:hypothetical protein